MRCLVVDTESYKSRVTHLSVRGVGDIVTDPIHENELSREAVTVIFLTIERGDSEKTLIKICTDLRSDITELGHKYVLVTPFAHLSHDLAPMLEARQLIDDIVAALATDKTLQITRDHFGSDKRLEVVWSGRPGAVRYRSTT